MAAAPGPVGTTPGCPSMTTAMLGMAGHALAPAGGQLAAGAVGNAVADTIVNAPVASGPVSPGAGVAVPQPASGFKEIGCPPVAGAGGGALPQLGSRLGSP